jgi:hypothetical protein
MAENPRRDAASRRERPESSIERWRNQRNLSAPRHGAERVGQFGQLWVARFDWVRDVPEQGTRRIGRMGGKSSRR